MGLAQGRSYSCPFGTRHRYGAAAGTGIFSRLLLLALDVQRFCHRLGSQVSSGTLRLGSLAPLCCSPGCLTWAGGRRHGWRRRFQRFHRLLPAPSIPLPFPELFAPQMGHLEELTGRIPVSCSARSMGKIILGLWKGVKSFRNAPRCSSSPFIYSPFRYANELPH